MSSYENYNRTSAVYDQTRQAQGLDLIRAALLRNKRPLESQTLLDAGCGTGQYSAALIDQVARIEAVDLNDAMLATAQQKLEQHPLRERIRFYQSSITELPIENQSVDAVMINQVLHHVPDEASRGWPAHRQIFEECHRVLRPGGVFVINSCSHLQLEKGFWFYRLIPKAIDRIKTKTCDIDAMGSLLSSVGFVDTRHEPALSIIMQGDAYFRPDGVFDENWRSGDSIWALASAEELDQALLTAHALREQSELEPMMTKADQDRRRVGQLTFTSSLKQN